MAFCRNLRLVVLMIVGALPGCLSGHLLDAARRRERPLAIREASLDRDRLVLRYTAEVTNDAGTVLGVVDAAAAIPLAALRAPVSPRADALSPAWQPPGQVARGEPVALARSTAVDDRSVGAVLGVLQEDGRDTALVWHDGPAAPPWAPVPTGALTRVHTAPWAWPAMPLALAADAVVTPVLVIFAPAVMLLGE